MTSASPREPAGATISGLSGTVIRVDPERREFALGHHGGVPPAIIRVPPEFGPRYGQDPLEIMRPGTRWAAWSRTVEDGLELIEVQELPSPQDTRGWPPSWSEEGAGPPHQNGGRRWGSIPRPDWFRRPTSRA